MEQKMRYNQYIHRPELSRVQITLEIIPEMRALIEKDAASDGVSVNEFIVQCISDQLDRGLRG